MFVDMPPVSGGGLHPYDLKQTEILSDQQMQKLQIPRGKEQESTQIILPPFQKIGKVVNLLETRGVLFSPSLTNPTLIFRVG